MFKEFYGYQVYSDGTICSKKTKKPLKYFLNKDGYYECTIYKNNQKKTIRVHQIIALVFVPGYQDGLTVNHKDGNKLNNNAFNLEWITRGDNVRHSLYQLNRIKKVSENNRQKRRKLTVEQVQDIRARRQNNETIKTIANNYQNIVSYETIKDVIYKRTFKNEGA